MAQRIKVPILILTGFLGSGKTSLLAQWLRAPEFSGAMVIVNELGEVGLDDRLVETSSDAPLLLENGCACCAASEDLNATLERLFWQRLHREIAPFSWVLIETTGIADPQPIIASLQSHALIAERYDVAGVVTTFDARRGPAQLLRHPECESQLAHAGAIVLTKTDIATVQEMERARAAIRSVRPQAAILASGGASAPAAAIVAALGNALAHGHVCTPACHDGHHDHDHHDHAHHSNDVTSAFAPLFGPIAYEALADALQATLARHEAAILRVKGTARSGAEGAIEILQTMPGEAIARSALGARTDDRPVGMTFIAQGAPASAIATDFLARLGLTAVVTENAIGVRAHD
ncbi:MULTISPECIES: GTP-binding protein [unclassified Beijerinckia]|uniref:CobW family GTP-binding protein n=1 Tax=unclassified Beijerinckia TaxID=2638183 RepID=UPI0008981213|nr:MULTISPECIES: GTP-binding protein [unclassified Beijerinckia]MDH7797026.1 G3E family GTPase [Beijerinckia sp. GAS462]SEC69198.1 GTPase, G3E family [Beijerinckia sp. 28-YEA-48]